MAKTGMTLEMIAKDDALRESVEDDFFFRLLCDEDLLEFFEGVDNTWLKSHQRSFLKMALTKIPADVDPMKRISRGHVRLFGIGLTERHFDMIVAHLTETLLTQGVDEKVLDEVVENVRPIRVVFETLAHEQVNKTADTAPTPESKQSPRRPWKMLFGRNGARDAHKVHVASA